MCAVMTCTFVQDHELWKSWQLSFDLSTEMHIFPYRIPEAAARLGILRIEEWLLDKGGAIFLRLKPATIPSAQRDRASSRRKLNISKLKCAARALCLNAVSGTMHRK